MPVVSYMRFAVTQKSITTDGEMARCTKSRKDNDNKDKRSIQHCYKGYHTFILPNKGYNNTGFSQIKPF